MKKQYLMTKKWLQKNSFNAVLVLIVFIQWVLTGHALAYATSPLNLKNQKKNEIQKPVVSAPQVLYKKKIVVTAYSSTPDQTDSTPCITANGFNLCSHNQENIVAANFLPFGSKIRIPEYYGEKTFIVQDRMNARYYYRADLWMKTRQQAKQWGAKYTEIEILE